MQAKTINLVWLCKAERQCGRCQLNLICCCDSGPIFSLHCCRPRLVQAQRHHRLLNWYQTAPISIPVQNYDTGRRLECIKCKCDYNRCRMMHVRYKIDNPSQNSKGIQSKWNRTWCCRNVCRVKMFYIP